MRNLLAVAIVFSGFNSFGQIEEVRRITKQLCSPEFHGRGYYKKGDSLAADYIVKEFSEALSVSEAAKMASMTEITFSRNFQTVTGHSFVEFLNRIRIGEACGMLYASDDQIIMISQAAGFKNLANFNRRFLKVKGMTPSEYRETARKDLAPQLENS